jgi:hypothetical protein
MTSLLDSTISFFVGDEACRVVAFARRPVTSLKLLRFLKDKLETSHVVSYFLNGRLTANFAAKTAKRFVTVGVYMKMNPAHFHTNRAGSVSILVAP